ncbi:hypothetical protein [Yoonia sp. BS5-3]|uniref:Porin n=1 Tax=Yoonia phaeophyticola TaxID=3137369 RepID=A0ABZ2V926_9RHOB
MFRSITMTAVAALMAAPAFADGVTYGRLSYDFSDYDADASGEFDVRLLQGDVEYEISQFLLTGQIANSAVNGDNVGTGYGASAAYKFAPGVLAGLGLFAFDPEIGDTTNGFEAFGQYETAQFGVAVNISQADFDEDNITTTFYGEAAIAPAVSVGTILSTESEFDGTAYKLIAEYNEGPIQARSTIDSNSEFDGGVFGVRGTYDITPQIRAAAVYQTTYGDDFVEADVFTIGGGYQLVDGLWFDASYGVINDETIADEVVHLQASLTFETGSRQRLDSRFSQDAIDDQLAGFGLGF